VSNIYILQVDVDHWTCNNGIKVNSNKTTELKMCILCFHINGNNRDRKQDLR